MHAAGERELAGERRFGPSWGPRTPLTSSFRCFLSIRPLLPRAPTDPLRITYCVHETDDEDFSPSPLTFAPSRNGTWKPNLGKETYAAVGRISDYFPC